MRKELSVTAIDSGTVIDHILPGRALAIIRFLNLDTDKQTITLGLNLKSEKMGRKDLIKLHNKSLSEKEARDIAIFSPDVTIILIDEYRVIKKFKACVPDIVANYLLCPNANCITKSEPIATRFATSERKNKLYLTCHYCNKAFLREEVRYD